MNGARRPVSVPAGSTALLVVDLISDYRFEDGARVARAALPAARAIGRLRRRARLAHVANIFVNDHGGQWKLDSRQFVAKCGQTGCRGKPILDLLTPDSADYFILKPTHAGFHGTALEHLLAHLKVRTLIMTGISAHQCILFTANEAYLRDFELFIPRDCIAAKTVHQHRFAVEYFRTVLHAETAPSPRLQFRGRARTRV